MAERKTYQKFESKYRLTFWNIMRGRTKFWDVNKEHKKFYKSYLKKLIKTREVYFKSKDFKILNKNFEYQKSLIH